MKWDFVSMLRKCGDAVTESPVSSALSFAFCILCATTVIFICGCEDDIRDIMQVGQQTKHEDSTPADDGVVSRVSEDPVSHGATSAGGSLVYKYGGFNGSNAVEDPNTQIADLHMSRSGLRYKWAKGNLRNWGVTPDTNAGALACAFYWDGKQWIGGKFDHISTSRTTRDFKNLEDYKGWRSGPFFAATKRAFCIVSKDGKKRTNLLETKEP